MELRGVIGGIYEICEWIMRLAYVNLLWLFFTLLGLGVLGFFPATSAMFTLVRGWLLGQELKVFPTFWRSCRKNWIDANLLGYFLLAVGILLYVDIRLMRSFNHPFFDLLSFAALGFGFLYLVVLLYAFPLYVHVRLKKREVVRLALFAGMKHPLRTLILLVCIAMIALINAVFPGLIPFLSGSVVCLVLMRAVLRVFPLPKESHFVEQSR
jgi:uncharacterized membrane protein YesL